MDRDRAIRSSITLLSLLAVVSTSTGCASWVAMNQPAPTHDELVETGMHRAEVEQILRTGGAAYPEPDGHTRVRYQYSDGAHQGSKVRIILYIAADIFTLFLSELIFWPIELVVKQDAERTGEAEYGETNRLDHFRVVKSRNRKEVINIGSGGYILLPNVTDQKPAHEGKAGPE